MKQYLTIHEMANALEVSSVTIHNWINNNEIQTILIGKRKYITLAEYKRYVGLDYDENSDNSIFANKELEKTFNAFYKLYPKKNCKHDAQRAWKKLNPSKELVDIIMENIRMHLKSDWQNNENVTRPAKYINNMYWEN